MSSMTIYACDKCGRLFSEEDRKVKALCRGVMVQAQGVFHDAFELCSTCLDQLLAPFKAIGPDVQDENRADARDEALVARLVKEKHK